MASQYLVLGSTTATILINGVSYTFPVSKQWTISDPTQNSLVVDPARKTDGIIIKNNLDQVATVQGMIRELDIDEKNVIQTAFQDQTLVNFTLLDEKTNAQLRILNAVIQDSLLNQTIDGSESQFDININLACSPQNLK